MPAKAIDMVAHAPPRIGPLRLPRIWPWALYAGLNAGLILNNALPSPTTVDWRLFEQLPTNLDNPYAITEPGLFTWSPLMAWVMAGAVWLGYWPWFLLHFGVVFLLRDRRFIALTLLSWPFWMDASMGNTFTFQFVAGALAWRGNRWAALAYLALLILIPRPVAIPLALLLLWRMPELRVPVVLAGAAHLGLVAWMGLLEPWIATVREHDPQHNIGPGWFLGGWWLLIGVPLAGWLTWKQRPGWAGLATSPYILPYYFLVLVWETRPMRRLSIAQYRPTAVDQSRRSAPPVHKGRPRALSDPWR